MVWYPIRESRLDAEGAFKSHLGDRPAVYMTTREHVLCAACATESDRDGPDAWRGRVSMFGVHESGPAIECDECGEEIESYYGEFAHTEGK
jgi:hypothetical protein